MYLCLDHGRRRSYIDRRTKFTNTLFEYLETAQKCVIWKRDKYDCILEKVGTNVLIPIPNVVRGKGDPRNLLAIVLQKDDIGYKLGTKSGLLRGQYTRNQFELSGSNFLDLNSVNHDVEISLRQAVSSESICEGQGFTRCGCSATGKTRCNTKRCMCKKSGLLCNSRCHPNITCSNK